MKATATCLVAALLAGSASAQSLVGGSTTHVQSRGDNRDGAEDNDDFTLIEQRIDASVAADHLRGAARVDGLLFVDAPIPEYRSALLLERLTLEWDLADVTLTAGDFAAQLGRGLALSVRPVADVGVDQTVRGARVGYLGERLDAVALVGVVNPGNLDPLSLRHVDDPGDLVAGGEVGAVPLESVRLALLGSLVVPAERLLPDDADWSATTGTAIELTDVAGIGRAGFEVDVQERALAGVHQQGAAAIGDVAVRVGTAALQLEGLYLSSYEVKGSRNSATGMRFSYAQPPTLELLAQDIPSDRDVVGTKARAEVPLVGALAARIEGTARVADARSPTAAVQAHGTLGLELAAGASRWSTRVGVRTERLGLEKLAALRDLAHLEADALVDLGRGFAVHGTTALELWRTPSRPYSRGSATLSLDARGRLSVGVEAGVDTEDPSPEVRHAFLTASTVVHLTSAMALRVVAGSQRGGIACLGGVCRRVMPFSGVKAELGIGF